MPHITIIAKSNIVQTRNEIPQTRRRFYSSGNNDHHLTVRAKGTVGERSGRRDNERRFSELRDQEIHTLTQTADLQLLRQSSLNLVQSNRFHHQLFKSFTRQTTGSPPPKVHKRRLPQQMASLMHVRSRPSVHPITSVAVQNEHQTN